MCACVREMVCVSDSSPLHPGRGESGRDRRLEKKVAALEDLLASKLAQFLDTTYSYTLAQLSSAAKGHLYKGHSDTAVASQTSGNSSSSTQHSVSSDSKPHPLKGGWMIQDYLTYDWYIRTHTHARTHAHTHTHTHTQSARGGCGGSSWYGAVSEEGMELFDVWPDLGALSSRATATPGYLHCRTTIRWACLSLLEPS